MLVKIRSPPTHGVLDTALSDKRALRHGNRAGTLRAFDFTLPARTLTNILSTSESS